MFGYVRAVTAVLPPEEQARYRAVYCGLCKTLGERYGKAAQLTLNYDFVFLALLLALRRRRKRPCFAVPLPLGRRNRFGQATRPWKPPPMPP